MYKNILIPIDHGNRNIKTEHFIFTSGLEESDTTPPLGEYLYYNNKYYTLTEKRIPYMRDKTLDERFFILTLFAIALEAEYQGHISSGDILRIELPIGLPPKHFGTLYKKYENFFCRDEIINFTFKNKNLSLYINNTMAFPQDYSAAMTIYNDIKHYKKAVVIDIGGFTLDYLQIHEGKPDLAVCDSLEFGVIKLYNQASSRINSEYDTLLEEKDIDDILSGNSSCIDKIKKNVLDIAKTFTKDILGSLRERGIDTQSSYTVFVGGGSLVLKNFIDSSKIGKHVYIDDLKANAKGYKLLYNLEKGGN